jgi:nitroreductase
VDIEAELPADTAFVEDPSSIGVVASAAMEFTDLVRKRRMVHAFEQRPVDRAVIDELLEIARRAPSAGFSQGTDFLVLDDPTAVARFWELTDDPQFRRDPSELAVAPPVVVLAFADPSRYLARYANRTRSPSAWTASRRGQ